MDDSRDSQPDLTDRRYTDREVALILETAAELEEKRQTSGWSDWGRCRRGVWSIMARRSSKRVEELPGELADQARASAQSSSV